MVDPKGEYAPFAEAMGATPVVLEPGGRVRLNPLAGPRGDADRAALLAALVAAGMERRLEPSERAAIKVALLAADEAPGETTLAEVLDQLLAPNVASARSLGTTAEALAAEGRTAALELRRLVLGELRGMFDGPTSAGVRLDGDVVVLDVSGALRAGALPVVLSCAAAAIDASRRQPRTARTIVVLDEAWSLLANEGSARWLQAGFKLARARGLAHVLVLHRLSDLAAAGPDGSVQSSIAAGLLRDVETSVLFAQPPSESAALADLLGLTETERDVVGTPSVLPRPASSTPTPPCADDDLRLRGGHRAARGCGAHPRGGGRPPRRTVLRRGEDRLVPACPTHVDAPRAVGGARLAGHAAAPRRTCPGLGARGRTHPVGEDLEAVRAARGGLARPVLAASVKGDLVASTELARRQLGTVQVVAPGDARSAVWDPVAQARGFPEARAIAAALTLGTGAGSTQADQEFWATLAAKLLAPLLLAANLAGGTIATVSTWLDRRDVDGALVHLERLPEVADALVASFTRDDRTLGSVVATLEAALEPLSAGDDVVDPAALLAGANTCYLAAPMHDQRRYRPLFSGLLRQVLAEAAVRAERGDRTGRGARPDRGDLPGPGRHLGHGLAGPRPAHRPLRREVADRGQQPHHTHLAGRARGPDARRVAADAHGLPGRGPWRRGRVGDAAQRRGASVAGGCGTPGRRQAPAGAPAPRGTKHASP